MADVYAPPFGTYTGTLADDVATLKALFDDGVGGAAHPDFNKISPAIREKLFAELDALLAAN